MLSIWREWLDRKRDSSSNFTSLVEYSTSSWPSDPLLLGESEPVEHPFMGNTLYMQNRTTGDCALGAGGGAAAARTARPGSTSLLTLASCLAVLCTSLAAHADVPVREFKLPSGTERLSYYGERPAWSPDGKKVAFIGESMGDAFEVDVATRQIRNLTAHFPHKGFYRVQYLVNGDYLLSGPRMIVDRKRARWQDLELWVLSKEGRSAAVPLGQGVFEGVAVSRNALKIAWTELSPKFADAYGKAGGLPTDTDSSDPEHYTIFRVGDIAYKDGRPRLSNVREIVNIPRSECRAETQDFRDQDREVIYSCLRTKPQEKKLSGPMDWFTRGVRLDTGEIITYREKMDTGWEEVENVSPDGSWTLVECGPEKKEKRRVFELCRLELDRSGRMVPITDYNKQGGSAANGVISPDGKWMAFMEVTDPTRESGTGDGILLMPLFK